MLNVVILTGRLTANPEFKKVGQNQTSACDFSVAVNRRFEKDKTDFINCQAWGNTAEFIDKYFTKGKMIIVIGRIATRSWETQDGHKRYVTEVIANEVNFGETKAARQTGTQQSMQDDNGFIPLDENDDDLPF